MATPSLRPRPFHRLRRLALVSLTTAGSGYLCLGLLAWAFQEHLLFPGADTQGRPIARFSLPPAAELVHVPTTDGRRIALLWAPALTPEGRRLPPDPSRPALLLFYGNGTWLASIQDSVDNLRRLGYDVACPDYLGFGLSEGSAGEHEFAATADAALQWLGESRGVPPERVVVLGYSLGGAVAIDLAARRPVAGVAVFNTFTSMGEMAGRTMPMFPVRWMLRHPFESERKLAGVNCPLLVVNGTADLLVPAAMADRLELAAPGPVTRLVVEGVGHDGLFHEGQDRVFPALARFVEQCRGAERQRRAAARRRNR